MNPTGLSETQVLASGLLEVFTAKFTSQGKNSWWEGVSGVCTGLPGSVQLCLIADEMRQFCWQCQAASMRIKTRCWCQTVFERGASGLAFR